MLPNFTEHGILPAGTYECTIEEFEKRFTNRYDRRKLYERGILPLMADLRSIGCKVLFIDGSYVTNKMLPNDFDACWDNTAIDLTMVKTRFPHLWGPPHSKGKYGGDVFPAFITESKSGKLFYDFFQTDRLTGLRKGIIKLKL